MTAARALPIARRFLAEAARTPVNLLVLVLVPVVFVVVAAGPMADAAELLGGPGGPAVQTAAADWAAGFIAAVAMYFQMRAARAADRRLVLAGLAPSRLVAARMATGLALALVDAAAALVALQLRTGISDPVRAIAGTLMFAVIYLAIGALIGDFVANPVNGTVLVLFVWILDVFFGPAIGAADRLVTRILPTHFVTLWMIDLPSHHAGRLSDLGWALTWVAVATAVGWTVITAASRTARPRHRTSPGPGRRPDRSRRAHGPAGNRAQPRALGTARRRTRGLRPPRRGHHPEESTSLSVREHGRTLSQQVWLPDVHGGTMAHIASLATLAGLFTVLDARSADQRLALAGFRAGRLLVSRLAVVTVLALLATAASLAVTATVFDARLWGLYIAASVLIALTYSLIGVLIGPPVRPRRRRTHRLPAALPRPRHRTKSDAAPPAPGLGPRPTRLRPRPRPHRCRHYPHP